MGIWWLAVVRRLHGIKVALMYQGGRKWIAASTCFASKYTCRAVNKRFSHQQINFNRCDWNLLMRCIWNMRLHPELFGISEQYKSFGQAHPNHYSTLPHQSIAYWNCRFRSIHNLSYSLIALLAEWFIFPTIQNGQQNQVAVWIRRELISSPAARSWIKL